MFAPLCYVNTIYGNTFKARSQTYVNDHNPKCEIWNLLISFVFFNGKKQSWCLSNWSSIIFISRVISIIIRKMNTLCTSKTRVIYFCSNWVNFLPENVHFFSLFFGSGEGQQLPSAPTAPSPTSCDYGYIEWQRVTTSSTTSNNEWQRVKTNVNEWYKE